MCTDIQAFMGGLFVNYFNEFGRTWQVYVEAEAPYRSNTQDLGILCAQQSGTECAAFRARKLRDPLWPEFTLRYNEYRSAAIIASPRPVNSSDQATAALEDVSNKHGPTKWASTTWACLIRSRKPVKGSAWAIFGLSLLFVFPGVGRAL